MQGYMCRISTLRGKSPPGKKGNQAAKDIKNVSAWLDMRQDRAIWLKRNVREASIKLNKQEKLMIMQLQLDIRESQGNGQHKVQEEYEALAQGHGGTKRDS